MMYNNWGVIIYYSIVKNIKKNKKYLWEYFKITFEWYIFCFMYVHDIYIVMNITT